MATSVLRRILFAFLLAIATQVACGVSDTLFSDGQLYYASVDTVRQLVVGEARAEAVYFGNDLTKQAKTKLFQDTSPCRIAGGGGRCDRFPVLVARSPTNSPDVQAPETDLQSMRQRLDEADRDKAAMSQSLQTMQAAVAEALKATKQTDDEKGANQALEADLRSMRKRLEDAGRDKAAMSQTLQAMQAAVAEALEATKRTDDEKAATQALETHLRSTRQRLEEVGRDKAAMSRSLEALQATVADRDGKLRAAETQAADLVASLAAAKRDAASTSAATKRSDDEKTAAFQSLRAMQAAVADREGKLKGAEARSADLVARLTVAKREATAASEAIKRSGDEKTAAVQSLRAMQAAAASEATKRSGDGKTAIQALEADLRSTRQRLEDAGRDKAAADRSLQAMQAAAGDRDNKLKAAEAQTTGLLASLAAAKRDTAATKQSDEAKAPNPALESELRATRQRLEDAGRDKAVADRTLRTLQAGISDRDGKLEAAEARTAGLVVSLATAKRDASAATKETNDGKAATQALEADLRATRQRLEDAGRDKAAADRTLHAMQTGVADRDNRLKAAEARTSILAASLAAAKREAAAATEATKRASDDRPATEALETELRATRQRVEDAGRDQAVATQSLQTLQAGVADRESKLKAAEARSADLVASLAAAKRDAAAATEATKRAADERITNLALQADLSATRQRLEDASRDKAAATQSLRGMQAAAAEREGKLEAAEARSAALVASLATAKHDAATSEATKRTGPAETAMEAPGRGPSEAGTPPVTPSNTQFPSDPAPSNVVLQYRAGNQVARQKATFLKSILDRSGIYSTNAPEAPNVSPGVHVTYYYKQDKTLARQVSKSITSSKLTQKRATRDRMPLPGTVEVLIGG